MSLLTRVKGLLRGRGWSQPPDRTPADNQPAVSPGLPYHIPALVPGAATPGPDLSGPDGKNGVIPTQDGPATVPGVNTGDRWVITTHRASSFEKVGRVVLDGNDLVLRTDNDHREFSIARKDVETALSGGTGEVRLPGTAESVGTARMSSSGRALNMVIDGKLHTVPLKLLVLVVEGKRRKVALFAGV